MRLSSRFRETILLFVYFLVLRDGHIVKKVNVNMKTASEMRMALIEKAGENDEFRAQLLSDPKSVIESEFGVSVPEGFTLNVHEGSADTAHLVLPPDPSLTTEQLTAAAGGVGSNDLDIDDIY